ncbi:MAG: recombinase family protein [Phycisphaerae bacterium]
MDQRALQGKRYIGLLRCSTRGQADTSIDDQRRVLEAFAREHGLVYVDEVVLGGVSGSLPGARDDIPQLIERKERADDFDVLVVQDSSRLTRAGIKHVHHLEWILNSAGIKVLYATGRNADGWVGELETSFNAGVDQAAARSISFGSARGSMSSILGGRSPYCRRPPYGIDRLYVAPDETPLHIIRNLPDGRQLQLRPETYEIIRDFGANEESGVPNHYIKQKQERIVLIPGDDRCVETLRRMYRRHYVDGLGRYRIAKELNDAGIPSPNGKKWTTFTIGAILRNPIYLGRGIANRFTSAVYHKRSDDCPLPVEVDPSELCNRKRPALQTRPESDWRYQDHPRLAELIEPEVREIAAARQKTYLDGQAGEHVPKPNRDRHFDSSFFLKGILHSKQGDEPMTGITTGKRGSKRRYYRVNRAYSAPDADSVMRRMVPADPLEQAILETVKQTLLGLPDLRDRIESRVRAELEATSRDNAQLGKLAQERDTIRGKLKLIIDRFDPEMKDLLDDEIGALQARLRSVNERISRCESVKPTDDKAISEIVDQTVAAIHDLANMLVDAPPATLRQLLQALISRLVVDLETRDVELEISLPSTVDAGKLRMCLVEGFACKSYNETHQRVAAAIAVFQLQWDCRQRILGEPIRVQPRDEAAA